MHAGSPALPVEGENAMDDNRIRERAYEIWEQEGRPEGRHAEHWERACRDCGQPNPNPDVRAPEAMDANTVPKQGDAGNLGRAAAGMGAIESGARRGAEERAPGAREEAGGGA